jgi:hypothetical protein
MTNSIIDSLIYQEHLNRYKTNLLRYQPGIQWYFGNFEKGLDFRGNSMTEDKMKETADSVSPIGPSVSIDEVVDITPTWEWLCEQFPDRFGYDESKFQEWISEQSDAFFYGREKTSFFVSEAFEIAANLGYRKVILENLS